MMGPHMGPYWVHIGPIMGPSWAHLGAFLDPCWTIHFLIGDRVARARSGSFQIEPILGPEIGIQFVKFWIFF